MTPELGPLILEGPTRPRYTHCGRCRKPFNAVRKHRGFIRVTEIGFDAPTVSASFPMCGPCLTLTRREYPPGAVFVETC